MKFEKVGLIGCGLMGSGIAQVCTLAGYPTRIVEADADRLDKGMAAVKKGFEKGVSKGTLAAEDAKRAADLLSGSVKLADLAEADIVIEAVSEDLDLKVDLFQRLGPICPSTTVFATNTSSLSVTRLMAASGRRSRFVGMHFFNPVPVMRLVELVGTLETSPEVLAACRAFAESLGKTVFNCDDRPGFLVNRLLIPYLLDAVRTLEVGTGSIDDLDSAMKMGCGHPMGPFELLDYIGLDTVYHIANILFDEFREPRFAPPPLLKRMVLAGRLGRKTGKGFHDYGTKEKR